MTKSDLSIDEDFIVIRPDLGATIEKSDATLYPRLDRRYGGFRDHVLVSCHAFDEDWKSWENHPHGDEIVILLSGEVTFVLQRESGTESIRLQDEGGYLVVPSNVWHTAKTDGGAKLLCVTPGEGTRHRET